MNNLSHVKGWLELRAVKGLGPITFSRLINHFGSPEAIRSATVPELMTAGELSPFLAEAIQRPLPQKAQQHIQEELSTIDAGQCALLTLTHPNYPAR